MLLTKISKKYFKVIEKFFFRPLDKDEFFKMLFKNKGRTKWTKISVN